MLKCSLFILLILYTHQCAFIGVGTSCFIQLLGEPFFLLALAHIVIQNQFDQAWFLDWLDPSLSKLLSWLH